jgi:hypothetical protein
MRNKTRKDPLNPARLSQLLLAPLGTQYDVIRVLVEPNTLTRSMEHYLIQISPNCHLQGIADTLTS